MSDERFHPLEGLSKHPQLLYYGKVIDTNDPQKLGRIRALISPGDINNIFRIPEDKLNKTGDDIIDEYKWKREDPFVYLPLLPFFIKTPPKKDELVHIFFGNKEYPQTNKFFIPGVFSSPTAIGQQNFEDAKTYLSDGTNYKEDRSIQDKSPNSNVKTDSYGVFPEPVDTALLGRGSADLVVKENTVLLRAGKAKIERGVPPVANNSRAFLELDYFPSQKETDEQIKKRILQEVNVKAVKYLIEFFITNPDNSAEPRAYTGFIAVYKLKEDVLTNTENLKQESDIEEFKPVPIFEFPFRGLDLSTLVFLIDNFIKGFNDGYINIEPLNGQNYPAKRVNDQFPFFFRLSWKNYNQISDDTTNPLIKENLWEICNQVNPFNSTTSGFTFFNLVSRKNTLGPDFNIKIEEYNETNYTDKPITYSVLGADQLYFISHKSEIPGKKKISIDKRIYGFDQEDIGVTMKDNTNSMVRGEKLLDLLNLIVNFMLHHVHPMHGLQPDSVGLDGTEAAKVRTEINNAYQNILNSYIRIN